MKNQNAVAFTIRMSKSELAKLRAEYPKVKAEKESEDDFLGLYSFNDYLRDSLRLGRSYLTKQANEKEDQKQLRIISILSKEDIKVANTRWVLSDADENFLCSKYGSEFIAKLSYQERINLFNENNANCKAK